ncbi:MAG: hypothetical protein JRJ03_09140 [Deltaproteobacteria bacterium]|nr:hypothetical protein [Deltaproteobacteria bacterium]
MDLKKTISTILIYCLFALAGCMPALKESKTVPPPSFPRGAIITDEMLDRKRDYYANLLQRGDLSEDERRIARELLNTYTYIKGVPPHERWGMDPKVAKRLLSAISHLEVKYFSRKQAAEETRKAVMHEFALKRDDIIEKYQKGDYQGVVNDCMELEDSLGRDALTPEIGLHFALSLAKKGLMQEAIRIGDGVLRKLEEKPDLLHLRSSILDWKLLLGQDEAAYEVYDRLLEDLEQRQSLVKSAEEKIVKIGERKGIKTGVPKDISSSIRALAGEFRDLEGLFNNVEELVGRHQFQEAKILLLRHRIRLEKGPEIDAIDRALNAVDLAEQNYHRGEDLGASLRDGILKTAARLIENEEYEEAIAKIEYLENEQGRSPETLRLKDIAIEKLINRERNRAAALFLRAKRSNDPLKKKELLLSANEILENMADRYPSSPLNSKIKDHIKKIHKELLKLAKTRQ